MDCPKCHARHDEGIYRCEQCGTDMIEKAPSGREPELVPVRTIHDPGALAMARSILGSAEIPFIVLGEDRLALPRTGITRGGINAALAGATVCVPRGRAEEARALLEGEPAAGQGDG